MSELSSLIPKTLRNILVNDGNIPLAVRGMSMLPYLREGDRVWLKKAEWEQIRLGDLVAFEQNQLIFTHRVICKSPNGLLTKGDNNFYPDLPLLPQRILGKVVAIERDGEMIALHGKHSFVNAVLGYCHAGIGIMGRVFGCVIRLTCGKLKSPLFWLGRGFLVPLKILERILIDAI